MGQHPRSVVGVSVTVGPWVIPAGGGVARRTQRGEIANPWEPAACGLYRDRDGDIWEKEPGGWRLRLQGGVPVDPDTLWDWADGHVRDYAPFVPLG